MCQECCHQRLSTADVTPVHWKKTIEAVRGGQNTELVAGTGTWGTAAATTGALHSLSSLANAPPLASCRS